MKEATESSRRRWERIAREAMKQSERVWLPEVVIDRTPFERRADTMWILADPEGDERVPTMAGSARVRLLIGPEGGITKKERERLTAEGATLWGLGPARLRAETAAIVGIHRLGVAIRTASPGLRVSL